VRRFRLRDSEPFTRNTKFTRYQIATTVALSEVTEESAEKPDRSEAVR
jgi:hypothetical protein